MAKKEHIFKQSDFNNPSLSFRLDDKLKFFFGGWIFKSFVNSFALAGNENVLDFGSGGGIEARFILKHLGENGHITCIDRSSYWLNKARKRLKKFPNVTFVLGDITKLDIPDKVFDLVLARYVIHDIVTDERQRIMNTLANKLKSGGALYIWEPIKISHGMPVEEIKGLLSKSGLRELSYEETKSSFKGKYLRID
jgi:ubiquinone/menaquinone biosynthesis C-methylase UbiE